MKFLILRLMPLVHISTEAIEPRHEKIYFMPYANNKVAICAQQRRISACASAQSLLFTAWIAQHHSCYTHNFKTLVMPPTSKKLTGYIGFGLCVHASICPSICSSRTVHARVLKFHIWILHGKIADTRFFSCLSYLPFWSYAPLKNPNEI